MMEQKLHIMEVQIKEMEEFSICNTCFWTPRYQWIYNDPGELWNVDWMVAKWWVHCWWTSHIKSFLFKKFCLLLAVLLFLFFC